jgi:hypothetical protein
MNRTRIIAATLFAICALTLISGCARWFGKRSAAATNTALFAVTADTTAFYKFGPQQGHGPDRSLTRDTLVTVIRRSFGYSKVRLEDGEQGFVANDDLTRAPERLIAQAHDASSQDMDMEPLPPTPQVRLPVSDPSPEFEPTPLPQPLMPQ